jgi:hypothetical protein
MVVHSEAKLTKTCGLYYSTESKSVVQRELPGCEDPDLENGSKLGAKSRKSLGTAKGAASMYSKKDETLVARIILSHNYLWVFDRTLIDENLDTVLDGKPEERVWLVVSSHKVPEYVFPTVRLHLNDVVKFGRVRFRVREIVSRQYNDDHHRL